MDENGLPITGAGVNYAAVEAINQRELVTYFNMFLARSCTFLNTFATTCEDKLSGLHSRLEIIDTNLVLLETKLNSVDELKDVKLESTQETSQDTSSNSTQVENQTQSQSGGAPVPPPPPPPPPGPSVPQVQDAPAAPPPPPPPVENQEPVMTVSQNPKYKKYFSMLKMGVHEEAIRIKMRTEGVDPSLLDNPDTPMPYVEEESSSSDSDSD